MTSEPSKRERSKSNVSTARSFVVLFIACLGLAACGYSAPIKKIEARAPIQIDAGSKAVPVRAQPVSVKMKSGDTFGENGQGPGCIVHPGNTLIWRPENEKRFSEALTGVLFNELQTAHYSPLLSQDPNRSVTRNLSAPAAPVSDKQTVNRAKDAGEILIVGVVKKITANICYQ